MCACVCVSISCVNIERSDCRCCLLNVTRWQQANWLWLKSTAYSKTQSLPGWASSLWCPPTYTHTYTHTGKHVHTLTGRVCLYTPHLCDPAEMSPKTDNPTVIQTVPSRVNNSIRALLNQHPSNATRDQSPLCSFLQTGSHLTHRLLYAHFTFKHPWLRHNTKVHLLK